MHISLDSALGQQRRLNSVGESITQIAPDPAAAYSLRSLTGGDPKVVRVRRESDNTERDFTASDVNSGALVDFVNTQTIKPLDVRALNTGTGERDGFFQIASAAYSLRSLGDRQATVAATGDTVTAANGKYVVQVRRSSDDTIKSFTADEVTDGTLVAFVGSGNDGFVRTWYDQSVTDQGGGTASGNHATQTTPTKQPRVVIDGSLVVRATKPSMDFGGNDFLEKETYTQGTLSQPNTFFSVAELDAYADENRKVYDSHDASNRNMLQLSTVGNGQFAHFAGTVRSTGEDADANRHIFTSLLNAASSNLRIDGISKSTNDASSQGMNGIVIGANHDTANNFWDGDIQELIVYSSDQTANMGAFEGNMADEYGITAVPTGANTVNGFVETWYDQSGNGKDATQTTAAEQPKIVSSGSLVSNGIDFASGSSATLDMPTDLISSTNSASAFLVAKSDTTGGSRIGLALSRNSPDFRFYLPFLSSSNFNFGYQDSATKISLGSANTNKHLFTAIAGSSNAEAFLDSTSKGTVSSADGKSALSSGGIGTINDSNHWNGQIEEILVYASDQSSKRTDLETNINSHYSIF